MTAEPPVSEEIDALLRLLDDETPVVRERVSERIALCGGDLSAWLAAHPRTLTTQEQRLLMEMLRPPRRKTLIREWSKPSAGAPGLPVDWEMLEAYLCALSVFLHDGISQRLPLTAALDLLAKEATESGASDAMSLRRFILDSKKLKGNQEDSNDPRNSDLAWSIAEGRSNPIGLGLIFILVGRRMNLTVEGINFPGHFLCRIYQEGYPLIIDCFDNWQLHLQDTLMERESDLTRQQRVQLRQSADPGTILVRVLNNLVAAFQQSGSDEDAKLIDQLRSTLGK